MCDNDIVISGMGARLPESDNTNEFWKNLFEGIDCVTTSDDRWPNGIFPFNYHALIIMISYFITFSLA